MEDQPISDTDDIIKHIHPAPNELYAILLKDQESFIGEIVEIDEIENKIKIIDKDTNKEIYFELDESILKRKSTKLDYVIEDIERVIPFDLSILDNDLSQIKKLLTSDIIKNVDISLEEIKEKDIVYTEIELKESLLSSLVEIYNAYDKLSKIKEITGVVKDIFELLNETKVETIYNFSKFKSLPNWLIPIVDNPIKLVQNDDDTDNLPQYETFEELSTINDIINTHNNDYLQKIRSIFEILHPIKPSISDIGYSTNEYIRKYLRNCLQNETCVGLSGNYKYDKRNNKLPLKINDSIVHNSDTLNITGLLFIPDSDMIQCLSINSLENISLREKIILQNVIDKQYQAIINLRNKSILSKTTEEINDDSIETSLNYLTSYYFSERFDYDKFYDIIKKITPSPDKVLDNLSDDIKSKILNYDDLIQLYLKYNIDITQLDKKFKQNISKLINSNNEKYIQSINPLPKIVVKLIQKELSIKDKIYKSKDIILNILSIVKKNEYLQRWIRMFTRESIGLEDKHYLYNIYTGEKLVCKHYLFSSVYHTNPDAHKSLLSIYGKPPEDGVIYCKHCGEYLCNEDFSAFEGFDDETPIQIREEIKKTIDLTELFKEEHINLVRQISSCVGVTLSDEDIQLVLSVYNTFNPDHIANLRYNMLNISDTDEHPLVKDIKKKHSKDKNKKELIKKDIRKFQSYLKDTNKILSLLSLIIICIQTAIPTYKNKYNFMFDLLDMNNSLTIENISYNPKVIDYCIVKLNKLCKLSKEKLWKHGLELFSEDKLYDVNSVNKQDSEYN